MPIIKSIPKKYFVFLFLVMAWIFVFAWIWCVYDYTSIFSSTARFFQVIMLGMLEAIIMIIPIYLVMWVVGFTGWFTYWCYTQFGKK